MLKFKEGTEHHCKEMRALFPAEVNVLIGEHVIETDKELFFGPLLISDIFVSCSNDVRFPILLKTLACFQSTGDAKGNGWNREIPEGWSEHAVGKAPKLHIFILKITKPIIFSSQELTSQ